ncbi:hypothetical protein [Nocardia acidivorans]|uniref:hypothetical protein n=1 Tax=Nocardia acidivorans TaxID=404580 RepID=UPI000AEC8BB3|nr:hypothetical protein [Nocardia acidivorans]
MAADWLLKIAVGTRRLASLRGGWVGAAVLTTGLVLGGAAIAAVTDRHDSAVDSSAVATAKRLDTGTITTEPVPAKPSAAEQISPTADPRTKYFIRGVCDGLLLAVDQTPGGLPALRAQLPRLSYLSPADWDEAFNRAATGSCQ